MKEPKLNTCFFASFKRKTFKIKNVEKLWMNVACKIIRDNKKIPLNNTWKIQISIDNGNDHS